MCFSSIALFHIKILSRLDLCLSSLRASLALEDLERAGWPDKTLRTNMAPQRTFEQRCLWGRHLQSIAKLWDLLDFFMEFGFEKPFFCCFDSDSPKRALKHSRGQPVADPEPPGDSPGGMQRLRCLRIDLGSGITHRKIVKL